MTPDPENSNEQPQQEEGDKIIHHAQLHAPTLQKGMEAPSFMFKQIVNSQFELLQLIEQTPNVRVHDETSGAFTVVLEDKAQAKHVFVYPPDQVEEIRKAFPDNKIPKTFQDLSSKQIDILYQHPGSMIALALPWLWGKLIESKLSIPKLVK